MEPLGLLWREVEGLAGHVFVVEVKKGHHVEVIVQRVSVGVGVPRLVNTAHVVSSLP